jgi:hypothetical protein
MYPSRASASVAPPATADSDPGDRQGPPGCSGGYGELGAATHVGQPRRTTASSISGSARTARTPRTPYRTGHTQCAIRSPPMTHPKLGTPPDAMADSPAHQRRAHRSPGVLEVCRGFGYFRERDRCRGGSARPNSCRSPTSRTRVAGASLKVAPTATGGNNRSTGSHQSSVPPSAAWRVS